MEELKEKVKFIPNDDVKGVEEVDFVQLSKDALKVLSVSPKFLVTEPFDAIVEKGHQLKFLKVSFQQKDADAFLFSVKSSRDIIKREYERIAMILEVSFDGFSCETMNISAGGMQVRSDVELQVGSIYDGKINYVSREIPVRYEILRVRNHKNRFLVSGKFVDMDKNSKAFIIQQNLKNKLFSLKTLPIRKEEELGSV